MTKVSKLGLLLDRSDLVQFLLNPVDIILIPPGVSISEEEVEGVTKCNAHNLNRYMLSGDIERVSRKIAPHIRNFLHALGELPSVAQASQNDLYQYHLRLQYYFLLSLETVLKRFNRSFKLYIYCKPYQCYWSPMRPEQRAMHSFIRLYSYLAIELVDALDGVVVCEQRSTKLMGLGEVFIRSVLRKLGVSCFRYTQLVKKVLFAKSSNVKARFAAVHRSEGSECIGIIVRTDSEVISASYLIEELKSRGINYLIIRDELLASQSSRDRLEFFHLSYVSVGSMRGLMGLLYAVCKAPRKIKYIHPSAIPLTNAADTVLLGSHVVWKTMCRRLLDFSTDQTHLMVELEAIIRSYRLTRLVTFAYVDQWGGVIRATGAKLGIPTIAVQNAGQDPEEYPRLDWSDHYCIESVWLRDKLLSMGYNPEKITATGLPQFASKPMGAILPWAARYGKKTLVILTQPIYYEYFVLLIEGLSKLCEQCHLDLVIKLHPRQNKNDYENVIKQTNNVRVNVFQKESLDSILDSSSIAISVVSATITRAIFLGIPVFSLLPIEEQHLSFPYSSHPVVSVSGSIEALTEGVLEFVNNFESKYDLFIKNREDYLAQHTNYYPTPNSQINIADMVLNTSLGD